MTAPSPEIVHPTEMKRGTGRMFVGAFVGVFAPITGFLVGSVVPGDATIGRLDPLFVWLFPGMILGAVGVGIGVWGALRWMKSNYWG